MLMSSLYRGAQNWTLYSRYSLTRAKHREITISLHLLARLLLMQLNEKADVELNYSKVRKEKSVQLEQIQQIQN